MAEVGGWQTRPLEPMHPVIFFDALRVKISEDAVRNKAIYLALGRFPTSRVRASTHNECSTLTKRKAPSAVSRLGRAAMASRTPGIRGTRSSRRREVDPSTGSVKVP